jgi:large subunit ribosomal protein L29
MKQIDIKDLSSDDLIEKLLEQKELLIKLKMSHAVSPLENPKQMGGIRKTIARVKTELRKRELTAANK